MSEQKWFDEIFNPFEVHRHYYKEIIYSGQTQYQKIEIYLSPVFGKILVIDGEVQSSQIDEYIYHESLVHPAMILHPHPQRVGIIGGGEGSTLREVLKHKSVEEIVMVDIDDEIVKTCKKYLSEFHRGAYDDNKVKLIIMDARKYIEKVPEGYFDVLISDIVEPYTLGPASYLFTQEFYYMIQKALGEEGVFSLQASHLRITDYYLHSSISKTLKTIFPIVNSFGAYVPSFDTNWGFILATNKKDPILLTVNKVNEHISEKVKGILKFYDGEAHQHIFSIDKTLRSLIETEGRIISDSEPLTLSPRNFE